MRTILHLDMDAFFVSVERLYDSSLIGKPVVVGGKPDQRGVVSAASYEARKFGVHSAMPLRTAYRLCPQAIFVEGHSERYREASRQVREVIERFAPRWEMASIDEGYLDLTGTSRLLGPPLRAAHLIHEAMRNKTKLNCSIGVSRSRLVSKVASDWAKPNGILFVLPEMEARFLAPLPVRRIPGVGKVAEERLRGMGIRRVGDLAVLDPEFLERRFGKWGLVLAGKAQGEDAGGWFDSEIGVSADPKSISHEHTFGDDTTDAAQIEPILSRMSEMVARRVREHGLFARQIQLKLRYSDFSTYTRAHTLPHGTQRDTVVFHEALALFRNNWTRQPVRLIGVQASLFERESPQMALWDSGEERRWSKALEAVDHLRDKYGETSVLLGSGMRGRYRERVHETPARRKENAEPPNRPPQGEFPD